MADPKPGEWWKRIEDEQQYIVARVEGDSVLLASTGGFVVAAKSGFSTAHEKQDPPAAPTPEG